MPKTIEVPTPAPPPFVSDDTILTQLWQSSLAWRVEMLRADASIDRASEIERVTRLAHDHDLATATITVAEAEKRWGLQNLRQNAKGRLAMWKSDDQRGTWLTTTYAMRATFGPEPSK